MRKFKPAPKQASANRIRERYLHQLGLQRGAASSSSSQQQHWDDHHNNNHVVVISGLPSLPEDRATNDNVLESHDFSHADGSYISCYGDEGSCSGGNKQPSAAIAIGPPQHLYQPYPPQGDSSHCSRSTLSTSPHTNNTHHLGHMADENMTSMALACPHSLLKSNGGSHVNNNGTTNNTTTNNSSSSSALPFSLSWGTSQLSRSAAVLLDEAGGSSPSSSAPLRPNNDHDSVSSAATATTAESSFTATMVSRDWGASGGATNNIVAIPHHPPSGTASVSSMGDSVTSAPGVFFQPRGGGPSSSNYASTGPAHCVATSSLASALNRFNIDSDCEASVASNSIIDDPTMMMDDCHIDDSASCASHMSGGSSISIASTTTNNTKSRTATKKKKKKIGKNQRLLDRASAHERMMQMRNDRSQKLRATMVLSQRASHCSLGGLHMPHQLGSSATVASSPARSCSSSVVSQASSIPLMHVDHQATPMSTPVAAMCSIGDPNNNMVMMMQGSPYLSPVLPKRPSFGGCDLGRTPTASNCSQQHTKTTLPAGVHYLQGANCGPLNYHPQLVSKIYMPPPPNVMALSPPPAASSLPSWSNTDRRDDSQSNSSQVSEMETNLANVVSSMQQHSTQQEHAVPPSPPSIVKRAAESVEDDVMEVAVTLSMLGGGRTTPSNGGGGMIPRVR
mmetsp:Transcript_37355/g.76231  ORF Transcript_37355/g.76231 Transcript_37355/m.76231 type:complete len:678 (+) Transcript_37355:349-2382(+)